MSLLKRVKKSTTAVTEERDVLGGRLILESNVYPVEIKEAFIYSNDSGSTACRISAKLEDGKDYTTDLWISDKKGNNYFVDKKTKEQRLLPGYIMLNSLLLLVAGKTLDAIDGDDDYEALELTEKVAKVSKDKNQTVEVLDDLTGVNSLFAIQKIRKNKTVKQGNEYVPTNEIVFDNELVKVFSAHPDSHGLTVSECEAEAEEAEFLTKWLERNKGKDRDLYKPVEGDASSTAAPAKTTGLAARKPLSRAAAVSTDDEGNYPESTEEEAPAEAPAAPVRKKFTRPN